jgi:HK97 family phage prohead protease
MPFFIGKKEVKSARELTQEEVKAVLARYKEGNVCGVAEDGTMFLQQQSNIASIKPSTLTAKEIREFCEERKIKWNDEYAKRTKTYVASDESVDSYGDIILQKGWNLQDRFKKNPAIMWAHNYSQPGVGSGIRAQVEDTALQIDVLFMMAETYPFADTVFKMVDAGFLKGASVGFIPVKTVKVEDEEERVSLGLGKYGVLFEKQILLELSVCPLGANKNALVQNSFAEAIQRGVIQKDELERIVKDTNPQTSVNISVKETIDQALTLISQKSIHYFSDTLEKCKIEDVSVLALVDPEIVKPGYEETENEVRYRVRAPGDFNPDTFRYVTIKPTKPRVLSVMGKLKGKDKPTDPMVMQALRFPKPDGWTVEKCKKWIDKHPDLIKAIDAAFIRGIDTFEAFRLEQRLEFEEIHDTVDELKVYLSQEVKSLLVALHEPDGSGGEVSSPDSPEPETDNEVYRELFATAKTVKETLK